MSLQRGYPDGLYAMADTYASGGGTGAKPRILLAEDDSEMRRMLATILEGAGYDVFCCENGLQLTETLSPLILRDETVGFDAIVTDIRMPWVTGMDVLKGLRGSRHLPPIILITAFGDQATHEAAQRLGAAAMLDKPFEPDKLLETLAEFAPVGSKG